MPSTLSDSQTFYKKVMENTPDGLNLKLCLECGNCSGICPFGYLMSFPPSRLIANVRADLFGRVLDTDSVWMCVSCYACTQVCPAKIPLTNGLMSRTKEELILSGNVPAELQTALENSQRYGNPMGESPRKRADWAINFTPEIKLMAKHRQSVDILWFVGDYPSYHPRVQHASLAMAKVLSRLGVDYGILGPEETSDGDSQRLAGEFGLFEMLAEKNGKMFERYEFKQIITTDPHAYNAIKNEYPKLGISYPVQHYTQYLFENLDKLKPLLNHELKAKITYHDPCYLGRANGIFEEPRGLLQAIPGIELVEMAHNRTNSLCCGGGGGGMWLDGFQWEKAHTRLSEWRINEAMAAKADILVVACPYESPRFEDAVKTIKGAEKLIVKDIVELIAESMGD